MNKKDKNAFTLVELLAVIVILGLILVITVPKITQTINNSKKRTLELTVRSIAKSAEEMYIENDTFGIEEEITCESVSGISSNDYSLCTISFDEVGNASVTINGKGRYKGLSVCEGTKTDAIAEKGGCGSIPLTVDLAGGVDTTYYKKKYDAGSEVILTNPTRKGYSFIGWSVTGTSASIIDNKLKVGTSATTITAIWEEYSEDYPVLLSGPEFNQAVSSTLSIFLSITEISFVDNYTLTGDESGDPIDVSLAQDGSILAYFIESYPDVKVIIVGNGSGGILLNEDSSEMFKYLYNLNVINGMELLRWVNVTNMSYMFYYTSIESVNLGKAKIIGDYAFHNCNSLTSITIPESVTSIGEGAFYSCDKLTSITIPDNVTSIGDDAFRGCASLTSINATEGNSTYVSVDGILYNKDLKELIQYPVGKTDTTFTIPNSVTSIGDSAFSGTGLTSITIPDSVTSIGEYAFYECTNLTSIEIPSSITSIGELAFNGCDSLTSINVAENNSAYVSVDGILYSKDLKKLIQYPVGKTDTTFTIPNSVTSIGDSAFSGTGLTSITIPDSVTSIGDSAFYSCDGLTNITIPSSVTSIGKFTFGFCYGLTSVTIPNSVTSIGEGAFYYCKSLTSVTIPNSVTSIGEEAFRDCISLTSITIPSSVTSIGKKVFYDCTSLKSVVIPNTVTSIGDYAFYECNSLTSIEIPSSVTSIGNYAFHDTGLTSITIPGGVTSIGEGAFNGCKNLTSVTIPDSVTSIGSSAFEGTSLTSITIPNSVTRIANYTFSNCDKLTSIIIPDSVTSIGDSAFYNCDNLTSVTLGNNVTSIGDSAFDYCKKLARITIPNSVTSIGEEAFSNCDSLTSIVIPNSVTSISDYTFSNCDGLRSVTMGKNVTSIGKGAFTNCKSLTSITIPDSVTSIGDSAFYGCDSLTSIEIPDSVISIGKDALIGCDNLTSIIVDENNFAYVSIDDVLYSKNMKTLIAYPMGKKDTTFTIPSGVTSIVGNAFSWCRSLTSIIIPNSVTSIGYRAFYSCTSLTDVYYTGTSDEWGKITDSGNTTLTNATKHYEYVIE